MQESFMHADRMQKRCKPMLTCVISVLEIASKAYTRTQDFDGPIGSTTKKMANFATLLFPFFHLVRHVSLPVISFADDRILSLEKITETLFPPSTKLFDKIDNYAHAAENLPEKFDNAIDKFPNIIHRVPFLDWALVYMISWLKFFISILTYFGSNTYKEKEIVVDTSINNHGKKKKSVNKSIFTIDSLNPSHLSVSSNYESENENMKGLLKSVSPKGEKGVTTPPIILDITKLSYKEILEKGTKENDEKKEDNKETDDSEANSKNSESEKDSYVNENKNSDRDGNEDPIEELFAAGWHMRPPKSAKNGSILRSSSYT